VDAPHVAPALLTKMSTFPSLAMASSASRLMSSSLALSAAIQSDLMPRPGEVFLRLLQIGSLA